MKQGRSTVFALAAAMALLVAVSAQAQTQGQVQTVIYPSAPPDHYLPNGAMQQYSDSYSSTIYSPSQYPTAQGQYLQVPNSYSQQGGPPPLPPGTAPSVPASATRYQLPIAQPTAHATAATTNAAAMTTGAYAPTAMSPATDLAPRPPPLVYPQTSGTSAPVMHPIAPASAYAPTSYNNAAPATYAAAAPVVAAPVVAVPSQTIYSNGKPATVATQVGPNGLIDLGTGTGISVGLQISDYRYQEHVDPDVEFVHIKGASYGLVIDGAKTFTDGPFKDTFLEGQLRLTYGSHDYAADNGLKVNGFDDYMFDIRGLAGHDFLFQNMMWNIPAFDVSPYSGLGFRTLFDDNINTGTPGFYRRYSHYLYIPVGMTERIRLTDTSRLSLNTEFDWMMYGWQISQFGDFDPGASDLDNTQHHGRGLRGSLMYEHATWGVGPFFEYWNIDQSASTCNNVGACGDEPHNQTIEYGLQGRYRF